ncbi:SRPBCC domain-containing protein [Thalassococcus sp. S3]|uniref:SRPBCC family protein n=1 Tax=Thalassococcus sp. S3 TaxID=2017482 RepID=UPI0010246866|nr:SRPBCC domain-containing protein [Thalassococcus sp. S3]QBF32452.1 ATPase [Thalassococcus sp. S3]
MTDTIARSDTTIRKSVFLKADKATVWAHLTDAKKLGDWFHPADKDMVEGAPFRLTSQNDGERMCWGMVEKMEPTDYMRWAFTVGPLNGIMTTVEWRLEEAPGGTRLTLTHSGLPEDAEGYSLVFNMDKGWHGFLGNLHNLAV